MMSQQGNEGFLDEAELPEQIHRYLDLKLDKDAFIRPSKEVVTELYTRFLDKTGYDWRRPSPGGKEPIVMAQMLNVLKRIFSNYNIDFEFNLNDLVAPTRKRTTTFLNVILYLLAVLEEKLKHLQQWEAQNAAEQQKVDQINREIAKKRVAIEELALRIGQAMSTDELRAENEAGQRKLEDQKQASEAKEQEGLIIKAAIEEENKTIAQLALRIHQTDEHIKLGNKVRELEQQESELKKKLAEDEIVDAQRLKQVEIEVSQAYRDLHKRRNEMEEFERGAKARAKEIELEIADIRGRREGLETKWKQGENVIKEHVERAHKQLEILRSRAENSMGNDTSLETSMAGHKEKLEALLGESKPVQQIETDRNSTFIKSKAPK